MLVILPSNSYLSGKCNGVKVIDTSTYFLNGYRSETGQNPSIHL